MSTLTTTASEQEEIKPDYPFNGMHLIPVRQYPHDDRFCVVPDGTDDIMREAFYEKFGLDPVEIICLVDPDSFSHEDETNPQDFLRPETMPPQK